MNIDCIHITPFVQEHLRNLGASAESAPVKRDVLLSVSDQRITLLVQEEPRNVGVAKLTGPYQTRPATIVHGICKRDMKKLETKILFEKKFYAIYAEYASTLFLFKNKSGITY